jgi:hypothetical protein
VLRPRQQAKLARGIKAKEHAMSQKLNSSIAVVGIDIGKNSFHVVDHDQRGAIVLRQKWSRGPVETRLANLSPCLIGMEVLSANEIARALISMMIPEQKRLNQRPDTLMQDHTSASSTKVLLQRTAGPYIWVIFVVFAHAFGKRAVPISTHCSVFVALDRPQPRIFDAIEPFV